MDIINESQPEFRQKIGGHLEQCAPTPHSISLEQITNILPLSLRELAWIIAICEGTYSYLAIPWEIASLRDRVDVLHNIFLTKITQEIAAHASADGIESLSFDARTDAIHKLMGIQWEITHDYNGKGIPTYLILSINDTEQLKSIIVRLLSAIKAKMVTPSFEPIQMMPWIKQSNKEARSNQIIRLLDKICLEQPIRINSEKVCESIHSYNLAWVIVICHRRLDWFDEVKLQELELTPLVEITNGKIIDYLEQVGHLHRLKVKWFDEVDLRGSGVVKKIISYEIPPNLVLEIISNESIYKIKGNIGSNSNHRPEDTFIVCLINLIINNVNVHIINTEEEITKSSNCDQSAKRKSSRKDVLSEALSREILPALAKEGHKRNNNTNFAKLCWEKLSDALKAIGCTHVEVAKLGSECDQDSLEFHAKHGTLIVPANNFKAFRQRIARMA